MTNKYLPYLGLGLIVVITLIRGIFYIVPEGQQALVFQLGKIQGKAKTEAGLYFKLPFIQKVEFLDKRVINWDGNPEEVPTGDKMYVIVDTTARYRISDAIQFRNRLKTIEQAQSRIDKVLDSATKSVISTYPFVESVRNTNRIFDHVAEQRRMIAEKQKSGDTLAFLEEEVVGEISRVHVGREKLSAEIIKKAKGQLEEFGINLIDVQLRRIGYKEGVEKAVHERMISERQRIAERIRSVGKGEQEKIKGQMELELKEIQSEAYRKVQGIVGDAEAESIKIYADAIGQNKEFYQFIRSLETYKKGLGKGSSLILSADSGLFKALKNGLDNR